MTVEGERERLVANATHAKTASPLGELTLVRRVEQRAGNDGALVGVYFAGHWTRPDRTSFGPLVEEGFADLERQFGEYFAGTRREFDLARAARGDDLHRRVWALIDQIPYGETATYGELAKALGDGTTPQEVGAAVGRNPLSIVVPCHRVVGAGGVLGGYAGGLERKQYLLDLEARVAGHFSRLF